jgi:putative glycosyltransferase (TIGR04372 family)
LPHRQEFVQPLAVKRTMVGSFWREMHGELRRHAGDERLPRDLRNRLRAAARRASERSAAATERIHDADRFPRTLLREATAFRVPGEAEDDARRAAERAGLNLERPFVALEIRSRIDLFFDAVDYLTAHDYTVVRVGDPIAGPFRRAGVIDLARASGVPSRDLFFVRSCRFLVCESLELQHASYTTNTPSLTVNARDPFSAYPVRAHGVYTLAAAIDLDTGHRFDTPEMLTEGFFRNARNIGHRHTSPAEIAAAVAEMHEGVQDGWSETAAQRQFRADVAKAGEELASRVPHVAKWGPVDGFIGDGRLARVQADRKALQ